MINVAFQNQWEKIILQMLVGLMTSEKKFIASYSKISSKWIKDLRKKLIHRGISKRNN